MRTPNQTNVFTETADPNLILEYPFKSRPSNDDGGLYIIEIEVPA